MNIADIVRIQAARQPTQPALVEDGECLDWATLQQRIEAASWRVREAGLLPDGIVALSLRSSIANSILSFAALRLGASVCLLDWRSPPAETSRILGAILPQLLITDRSPESAATPHLMASESLWQRPPNATTPATIRAPTAPAFLMLSSGTTGQPKAALISHRAVAWRGFARIDATSMRRGLRVLQVMPVASGAGIACLVSQLMAGATTWFEPPLVAAHLLAERILRLGIEQTGMVPTIARAMLELASSDKPLFPDLEAMMVQSARFHPEEKRLAMTRLTPALYDGYGSLGTGMIAVAGPADAELSPASVGRAVMFCRIEVADPDGRALPTGSSGRVRVRSPGLADGYLDTTGRDERDEIFDSGWAYPGDLGRIDERGLLHIEGRAASMIIRGGQTFYPEEIEQVLLRHPAIADAAVIGRPDRRLGEVPVALIVARGEIVGSVLITWCRANLQPAKVPVAVHLVSSLPKTENGKIRRSELAALLDR